MLKEGLEGGGRGVTSNLHFFSDLPLFRHSGVRVNLGDERLSEELKVCVRELIVEKGYC